MFCRYCGEEIEANSKCTNPDCASQLISTNTCQDKKDINESTLNPSTNNIDNSNYTNENFRKEDNYYSNTTITNDDIMFYTGTNTSYYMDKWTRYTFNNNFTSWNWAAFFLSVYWLIYRKMYAYGAILFGFNFVFSLIFGSLPTMINLTEMILLGLFANKLYFDKATKDIENTKAVFNTFDPQDIRMRISSKGGVNIAAPFIFLFVLMFIAFTIGTSIVYL